MEGFMLGVPSIAFSQVERCWAHIEDAAQVARVIVQQVLAMNVRRAMLWNVNIPNLPIEQLNRLEVTRLGRRHWAQDLHRVHNPRGETMYWIGAAGEVKDGESGTDFHAVASGAVSLTPLQVDMTGFNEMTQVREWFNAVALNPHISPT
jgi:5'-nucleotidase